MLSIILSSSAIVISLASGIALISLLAKQNNSEKRLTRTLDSKLEELKFRLFQIEEYISERDVPVVPLPNISDDTEIIEMRSEGCSKC